MARLVVLGGGESGYGSAILATVKGFDVFLSDSGTIADRYARKLAERGVPFEQGRHTEELILNAGEVIKSPGIPDTAPIVKALHRKGVPVISEIEFAGRYCNGKTICITGSNGKTTTTALTCEILKNAGFDVASGGNIGESFAYSVATASHDWYVLELSSFQLDGMFGFRADIAVLMNITPDHLDRYDYRFENYAESKFRIVRNQRSQDFFIYCADDTTIREHIATIDTEAKKIPFAQADKLPTERLKIKGKHNRYNALAASAAASAAGVPLDRIIETLESFPGVGHRLEPVGTIGGAEYINDSKGTNVDSVRYALESMDRPVVWIAGGTDKGNDYAPLMEFACTGVKALICMGVDNGKLKRAFEGIVPVIADTHSLEEAMEAARAAAREGDVVLLSPACASFDLFRNYEERGERFRQWVKERM